MTRAEEIRSAKDIAARKLTPKDYQDLLGELMDEAESWRMELEEGEGGETKEEMANLCFNLGQHETPQSQWDKRREVENG